MKYLFLTALFVVFCTMPVAAQETWVFGNPTQSAYQYNSTSQTIQYYPPELGANSRLKYNKTTPYFYQIPGRIEPNVQPNPLKDELEKTDYV